MRLGYKAKGRAGERGKYGLWSGQALGKLAMTG